MCLGGPIDSFILRQAFPHLQYMYETLTPLFLKSSNFIERFLELTDALVYKFTVAC